MLYCYFFQKKLSYYYEMKRYNSNPDSTCGQSNIIAGNVFNFKGRVESISDEEDYVVDDNYPNEGERDQIHADIKDTANATTEEVQAADKLLFDIFGINVISVLVKLLLTGSVIPREFTIQSVAYMCQCVIRGKSGVRYLRSWGLFWAAARNIVKTRGIVPFMDHFSVPSKSQLVKYKSDALSLCGLEKSSIGKPGIQTSAINLWVNAKTKEADGEVLAVSACMDGKKIAISSSDDAAEDMGEASRKAGDIVYEELLESMIKLVQLNDRRSLFTLYDHLTQTSQDIVDKVHGCEILEGHHTKRLEKNPNMAKYIHVLKSKARTGRDLLENISIIQGQVIVQIAEKRNSRHLLPNNGEVNLETQANFEVLELLSGKVDRANLFIINQNARNEHLLEIGWNNIKSELVETFKISRRSESFKRLLDLCYLKSDQVFIACGLGGARPVQEMRTMFNQSHSFPSSLSPPSQMDTNVMATFCSIMSPMTFGNNCTVKESGIHIKDGVCAVPDLLVLDHDKYIEYTVQTVTPATHIFNIDIQTVAHMVVDGFVCGATKGTLTLQSDETSVAVMCVPLDNKLAEDILTFCYSYISANKARIDPASSIYLGSYRALAQNLVRGKGGIVTNR